MGTANISGALPRSLPPVLSMYSLDSLPDNDYSQTLPCARLLQPGSRAEAAAARCKYRRESLHQRAGLVVDTDVDVVDAFVRNGAAPDTTSVTSAPTQRGILTPILTPGSVNGADDLRELEARKRQLQEEVEQLESRKQSLAVPPDGAYAAEAMDGRGLPAET